MRKLNLVPFACMLTTAAIASPEALENARGAVGEWVEAEKAISRETVDWEAKKTLLLDLIDVANTRIEKLEKALAESESSLSTTDEKRADLLDRSDAVAEKAARIQRFLTETEAALRSLKPRLPEPLQEEMAAFYQRLPADPAETKAGLGERMQTVVGILTAIRQFDGKITVSETTRALPEKEAKGSFRTLWLGLGQAYYLAPGDAGVGIPGPDGWQWHSHPELAAQIREAIALAEGTENEPRMIDLPVRINKGATE